MESLIHNVKDLPPEKRRGFEAALGETLRDDQCLLVVVVSPGVEPGDEQRAAALADMRKLGVQGEKHRETLPVSVEDANQILEEAMESVRPTNDVS